ncbi:DNA-binding response regulator, NarL/FixJ family, contains REC and HTH domains [Amycolatopsis xylanica]|uniref:DNA-binding response regulator, NarL/FixJ family, contains REC and HTH domains n=1 Tax=Amycolatopsis xylanica TaxID=589385 RepID=A0A1H3M5N4_9PSEU|nr:response regulator transcription factor [Amycolatopsis xylanica]SDY72042.1 DNA-binding response regulator, NarL/FixJ family, contains REC and HTH domains [Amycolatopsis xylanica]
MLDTNRTPVVVRATDPILHSGVCMALRSRDDVRLVDGESADASTVALLVTDRLDDAMTKLLSSLHHQGFTRIVLVAGEVDDNEILSAIEHGVCAVARRAEAGPEVLVRLIKAAAAGEGALPPDMLGRLLNRVSKLQRQVLQPRGLHIGGMSKRETEVIRLVASGLSTQEIADELCYSQRTVKSILHDVTNRFQLRNRSHAVAYALREGLI